VAGIREQSGDLPRLEEARQLFERVALADDFADFLTLPAYEAMVAGGE
jgi:malate synthase